MVVEADRQLLGGRCNRCVLSTAHQRNQPTNQRVNYRSFILLFIQVEQRRRRQRTNEREQSMEETRAPRSLC